MAAPNPLPPPTPAASKPAAQASARRQTVPSPAHNASTVLSQRFPAATIGAPTSVAKRDAFAAVWGAHRARAGVEQDVALMITADALVAAAQALPSGGLVAAEVTVDGVAWAVFVDTTTGRLIGGAQPAALYLAGV